MIKLLYILSHIDKANEFEWLIERINDSEFQLEIEGVILNQSSIKINLKLEL